MDRASIRLAVVGLGYVGLPLAVEFASKFPVVGYDIDARRVAELQSGYDRTQEVSPTELASAANISFTTREEALRGVSTFVVTTPTPIDDHKQPDLSPVISASKAIGRVMREGATVIYESTVYPGATEEICVPILEQESGLTYNIDFTVGYSPERINPGDRTHRLASITKVTSGSTPAAAEFVDDLYRQIITAGTHRASSIRVAEAAKVIENTQRDVNIALINELAMLFNILGIETAEVLEAAGTKWNFLPFKPGLVGGHCIGVDPYYLTHKAQEVGYHPEIILAGRRLNDSMGQYVAARLIKEMVKKGLSVLGSKVLVLGLTFKEDTPDLRNTRVVDVVRELESYGASVDVHDPWADAEVAKRLYGIELISELKTNSYDAVILAVNHREYRDMPPSGIAQLRNPAGAVVYDLKNALGADVTDIRL